MADDGTALEAAIRAKLAASTAVTGLLNGGSAAIHYAEAPDNAVPPFVVFWKASGVSAYTMGSRAWEDRVYVVKAITEGDSAAAAKRIDKAVDATLSDAALTVSGRDHLYLRRESDVEYRENADGVRFDHVGAQYRVWIA